MSFKYKPILTLSVIACIVIIGYLFCKRDIEIMGFAYKGDLITIRQSNITLQKLTITNRVYRNNTYYFYEKFHYYNYEKKVSFTITIDSGTKRLLDTIITLPIAKVKPVISFEEPGTNNKRKVFLVNEYDKGIVSP